MIRDFDQWFADVKAAANSESVDPIGQPACDGVVRLRQAASVASLVLSAWSDAECPLPVDRQVAQAVAQLGRALGAFNWITARVLGTRENGDRDGVTEWLLDASRWLMRAWNPTNAQLHTDLTATEEEISILLALPKRLDLRILYCGMLIGTASAHNLEASGNAHSPNTTIQGVRVHVGIDGHLAFYHGSRLAGLMPADPTSHDIAPFPEPETVIAKVRQLNEELHSSRYSPDRDLPGLGESEPAY